MTETGIPVFYGAKTVAQWCGVPVHSVSNWLRRYDDYPVPAGRCAGPDREHYFWREDQREEWLHWAHGKDVTVMAARPEGLPPGIAGSCLLALAILGEPAGTAEEIRAWLEAQGETYMQAQVRDALGGLALAQPPLVERMAGQWQLTERGHASLAAED